MTNSGKFFNVANLTIGVLGLLAAVGGAGIAIVQGWSPLLFGQNARFSCQLQPDTQRGGDVWTVMYRHDKGEQPWLKMVTTLGGSYTPQVRCQQRALPLHQLLLLQLLPLHPPLLQLPPLQPL